MVNDTFLIFFFFVVLIKLFKLGYFVRMKKNNVSQSTKKKNLQQPFVISSEKIHSVFDMYTEIFITCSVES